MFNPISHHHVPGNRRHFLRRAGVLAAGGALAPSLLANAMSTSPIGNSPASRSKPSGAKEAAFLQIGILLGTFVRPTLRERLDAAKSRGLECVQVSMDCAGLSEMPDQISSDLVDRIRSDAASSGITIAAVQGTFNMAHPDADHRQTGLRRLRVIAEACPRMGASMIHICSGTRSRESMWRRHPDNNSPAAWLDMAACMREAAEIARQSGTLLAFEPEVNNVVDSAQKARRLLDEIASTHLKVTIDPANIFHTGELPRMREILDEAFDLLGKDIVMAHAKDLDHDGDAGHKAAGQGRLDYDHYLKLLHTHGFRGPLLLHGLSEAQVPGCVAFLREKLRRLESALAQPAK